MAGEHRHLAGDLAGAQGADQSIGAVGGADADLDVTFADTKSEVPARPSTTRRWAGPRNRGRAVVAQPARLAIPLPLQEAMWGLVIGAIGRGDFSLIIDLCSRLLELGSATEDPLCTIGAQVTIVLYRFFRGSRAWLPSASERPAVSATTHPTSWCGSGRWPPFALRPPSRYLLAWWAG